MGMFLKWISHHQCKSRRGWLSFLSLRFEIPRLPATTALNPLWTTASNAIRRDSSLHPFETGKLKAMKFRGNRGESAASHLLPPHRKALFVTSFKVPFEASFVDMSDYMGVHFMQNPLSCGFMPLSILMLTSE